MMKFLSVMPLLLLTSVTLLPSCCYGSLMPSFFRLFTTLPLSFSSSQPHDWNPTNPSTTKTPEKLGIILLNLGGPEKQEDVQGFLYNLFADPDIIRLPKFPCPLSALQKPIAYFISKNRAPKSMAAYQSIGGGSPINMLTKDQAKAIEVSLAKRGIAAKCYVGMRYWAPYTTEALEEAQKDGITNFVILPLYPHYSISTSGSSLKELKTLLESSKKTMPFNHTVIPYWFRSPGYLKAMAQLIAQKYDKFSEEEKKEGVHVLFSAHGVPVSYIASGDPYKSHIEECALLISQTLESIVNQPDRQVATFKFPDQESPSSVVAGTNPINCELSFQSRVGPVQWLQPYTDHKITEMGSSGVKNLIVVPISFVSEHIETLEEIDIEYKELALESGIRHWERASALNSDPLFIEDLTDLIVSGWHSPQLSISDTLESMQPKTCEKPSLLSRISRLFRRSEK